jgi:integrase
MPRIYFRRDTKVWCIDAVVNGQRVRRVAGPEREDAERALLRLGSALDQTLGALSDWYLADLARNGSRPRTIEAARTSLGAIHQTWPPYTPVSQLAEADEIARLTATRADCSAATRLRDLRVLKCLLREAVERGWLAKIPRFPKIRRPSPKPLFLTPTEVERLLLPEHARNLRALLTTLSFTGMRVGEARTLTWSHVLDLDGAAPRILITTERSKTHATREVPLHPRVVEALRKLPRGKPKDHVFLSAHGRPWSSTGISEAARAAVDRAGLGDKPNIKPCHSLRAFAASRMLELGASLEEVRGILGWECLATAKNYLSSSADGRREAVLRL